MVLLTRPPSGRPRLSGIPAHSSWRYDWDSDGDRRDFDQDIHHRGKEERRNTSLKNNRSSFPHFLRGGGFLFRQFVQWVRPPCPLQIQQPDAQPPAVGRGPEQQRAEDGHDDNEGDGADARSELEVDDDDAGGDGDAVADDREGPGIAFGGFVDEAAGGTAFFFVRPACIDAADAAVRAALPQAAPERRYCIRTFPAAASDISHTSTKTIRYRSIMTSPSRRSDAAPPRLAFDTLRPRPYCLLKIWRLDTSLPLSVPFWVTVMTLPATWYVTVSTTSF